VTVALSGDGGDEAFGGYRRYLWHIREEQVRRLVPRAIRGPVFGALARIYPEMPWAPRRFRARATLYELAQSGADAYFAGVAVVRPPLWRELCTPRLARDLQGYQPRDLLAGLMGEVPSDDALLQAQYVDMKTWLAGRMLVKVDRASMAHSLEVRCPMLDHELFGWALTLPQRLKVNDGAYKIALKAALEPLVPHDLLYRPKQGFAVPVAAWLRGSLRPAALAAISSSRLADTGLLDPARLKRLLDDHLQGRGDFSAQLWAVMMFERFLARHDSQSAHQPEEGEVRQRQFA
jgi:asparagine synthase (glutamine-hydrolysing)